MIKLMRPLFHPSIEDVSVEGILHALSDPIRVAIFSRIAGSACPHTCSTFLDVGERSIPKSTLSHPPPRAASPAPPGARRSRRPLPLSPPLRAPIENPLHGAASKKMVCVARAIGYHPYL